MRSITPFLPMLVFTAFLSCVQAVYFAAGRPLPSAVGTLSSLGLGWLFVMWMVGDALRRRSVPCFEFGFLVGVYLPWSLVWYVLWTRGWRGCILLAGFLVILVAPWVTTVLVWSALHGST